MLFSRPFVSLTQGLSACGTHRQAPRSPRCKAHCPGLGFCLLGALYGSARDISLFSRPFVSLTQAAKIAKGYLPNSSLFTYSLLSWRSLRLCERYKPFLSPVRFTHSSRQERKGILCYCFCFLGVLWCARLSLADLVDWGVSTM